MNTKHNRRAQNSEERMEQAFLTLLPDKAESKVTVKVICERAHVNRTTFYAHYLDVYDMVDHIQARKQKQVVAMIDATLLPDLSNFVAVIATLFEFVKDNRAFYQMYLAHHSGILVVESQVLRDFAAKNLPELPAEKTARQYRMAFFVSGLGAVMRRCLRNGCVEAPVAMAQLIEDEYRVKG